MEITKQSETEVQITTPQPDKVEVRTKDELISEQASYINTKAIETESYNQRMALFDNRISELQVIIDQATALEVKTQEEILAENPIVEPIQ